MMKGQEIIREAIRARTFTGIETLAQGMNLIDFALKWRKKEYERS